MPMPTLDMSELDRMRDAVFFDGPDISRRLSRFWVLLVLASIIAAAGVVADSTATVIGAMIVAPLMTPILGTMLSVVLADRGNLMRSIALVVAGAVASILIGYLVGMLVSNDVVAATNSQVAARVSPRLIDLLAALATGVVGSVALVRRDISDTLPGVAIAISLVPPLSVVGLTAEAGHYHESFGALLLFSTNVAAILATGILVMGLYRVHRHVVPVADGAGRAVDRRKAIGAVVVFFVLIGVPLGISSRKIATDTRRESDVRRISEVWADSVGWSVLDVTSNNTGMNVRVAGAPPIPDTASLAAALRAGGIDPADVVVEFIPQTVVALGDG